MKEAKKSAGKTLAKVVIIFFSSIIILFSLFILTLNIFKHAYYNEYFDNLTKVCKNPGLNDGYIPQGVTFNNGFYYTTGYMKDGSASRIYKAFPKSDPIYVTLQSNGKDFTGHTGGLQFANGNFYLANESDGLYVFPSTLLDNAENADAIDIGSKIDVNNHSSYVFSDDVYLYVGEFNNDAKYQTTNVVDFGGNVNKAIVTKYALEDLSTPVAIYSVPNEIQGFCVLNDGRIVLSRSYSISSSNFFIYEEEDIIDTGTKYDGAPLYFLGDATHNIKGPSMSEDLDVVDGKVITVYESASNKYNYGKLFGATYIAELTF